MYSQTGINDLGNSFDGTLHNINNSSNNFREAFNDMEDYALHALGESFHAPRDYSLHDIGESFHAPEESFHALEDVSHSQIETSNNMQESTIDDSDSLRTDNHYQIGSHLLSLLQSINSKINIRTLLGKYNKRLYVQMYNMNCKLILPFTNIYKKEVRALEYKNGTIDSILDAIHNNDIHLLCTCLNIEPNQNFRINIHIYEQLAKLYELEIINFFIGLYLYGNGLFIEDIKQAHQIINQLEPKFLTLTECLEIKQAYLKYNINPTEIYNLYLILQKVGLDIQEIVDLYSIIFGKTQLSNKKQLNISVLNKFWNKLLIPILTNDGLLMANIINPQEISAYCQKENLIRKNIAINNSTKTSTNILKLNKEKNHILTNNKSISGTNKIIKNKRNPYKFNMNNNNNIPSRSNTSRHKLNLDKQLEIHNVSQNYIKKVLNVIHNQWEQDLYNVPLTKFVINQILQSPKILPKINTDFTKKALLFNVLRNNERNKKQHEATEIIFLLNTTYPNIEKLLNIGIDLKQVIAMEEAKILKKAHSTISHVKTILNEISVSFTDTMELQNIVNVIPEYMQHMLEQVRTFV